ncbi:hypothetical protein COO60DRAFT_136681 [Scenedesmus sp. NREL 46B-D3]|nr:hypothetical protein COO60DRAFT_136681 [Scenedesmus sp. NREL 46B-D3]
MAHEERPEQQWVRAVRLMEAGTGLHLLLQHTPATAAAASNASQEATYQLCVLDARGSKAWSSSFSKDDVEEALRQDLTDLGPEVDSALAHSIDPSKVSLHWSGRATTSQLFVKAQYDRPDFVPATFRLPPFGVMEAQQGPAFCAASARVLDLLTEQSSTLQQTATLLQVKLQELASHARRVHDSYCEAVDSMATQPGHDYTPGSILDRTAAAAAAAAEPASKRQRVAELALPSLSPGCFTSAVNRLDSDTAAGSLIPSARMLHRHWQQQAAMVVAAADLTSPL